MRTAFQYCSPVPKDWDALEQVVYSLPVRHQALASRWGEVPMRLGMAGGSLFAGLS